MAEYQQRSIVLTYRDKIIEQRIKELEEKLSKDTNPTHKRLNEIIKEMLEGIKESRILFKNYLENVRKRIAKYEEKAIKLFEEFEKWETTINKK